MNNSYKGEKERKEYLMKLQYMPKLSQQEHSQLLQDKCKPE